MKKFSDYETYCIGMTLREAMELLIELDADQDVIILDNNKSITIRDYCQNIPGSVWIDSIGPFQFCGGPPGQFFWIAGTLKHFVMEKLMYRDAVIEVRYGSHVA